MARSHGTRVVKSSAPSHQSTLIQVHSPFYPLHSDNEQSLVVPMPHSSRSQESFSVKLIIELPKSLLAQQPHFNIQKQQKKQQ